MIPIINTLALDDMLDALAVAIEPPSETLKKQIEIELCYIYHHHGEVLFRLYDHVYNSLLMYNIARGYLQTR